MVLERRGDPDLGGDRLARRHITLAERLIQRWLPPVVRMTEGVCRDPTGGAADTPGNRTYIALVDVGNDQVHAEWTPYRFTASQLRGKKVRLKWDDAHDLRIIDDIVP